jgi:SAM-dependent methyltransferase
MKTSDSSRATRGKGLLEPFLARLRARQANKLIPDHLRDGRILDVGCGTSPYFLAHTEFKEKFAVDQLSPSLSPPDIHWYIMDINAHPKLPFKDAFFTIVTMLAVAEHLDPVNLISLFQEANRILKPGGMLIITTPAAWSDGLLRWMARVSLVSKEEIEEHTYSYTLPLLGWCFGKAGFEMGKVRFGYFEMMFNLWAIAERER